MVHSFSKNLNASVVCGRLRYWKSCSKYIILDSNPSKLLLDMTINHPTVFVKLKAYKKYGLFKNEYMYAMDYELMLRFYINSEYFIRLHDVIANMRLGGMSYKNWIKAYNEVRKAKITNIKSHFLPNILFFYKMTRTLFVKILKTLFQMFKLRN